MNASTPALATFKLDHGTLEVRGFYRLDHGWGRREIYTDRAGKVYHEQSHALNDQDLTPPKKTYPTGCDSLRCGWCYLNAPHTEAAHDDSVKRSGK